jgi:serine/threonine protein phosphatase 1
MSRRVCAVGDIHGYSKALSSLLRKVGDIPLIFIGDYIDRGPDSAGVLKIVSGLVEEGRAHALLGNHEDMMLRAVAGDRQWDEDWWWNGADVSVCSFLGCASCSDLPKDYRERLKDYLEGYQSFFDSLAKSYIYQDEHAVYVHGGFIPGIPLSEQQCSLNLNYDLDILWIREPFLYAEPSKFTGYPLIVHGHTFEGRGNAELPHRINIDGGTYRAGGSVRAVILPERKIIDVPTGA